MDESEFHDRVARAGEIDEPEPIATATVETLGESLSSGQAEDVATHLPDEYATALTEGGESPDSGEGGTGGDAVTLSRMEFVERVRERASEYAGGTVPEETDELRPQIAAVTDALEESIPREEQRGIRSQIPDDVESLFTGGESGR